MTTAANVSVRIPVRILEQIPAPGSGRSSFIVKAIEEKIARRKPAQWKPQTARGRRLAALLERGKKERTPFLSDRQIEQELNERRGRNY